MLPLECIVRGYITGSGWASYQKTGSVCGITLEKGLQESQKLSAPIYTPSTKADLGDHDENISYERSVEVLEKAFPGHGEAYAATLKEKTLALYSKCADYALSRGIIIADTKFEFGLDENGVITLADEMLTPDSSRFWPLEGYREGTSQPSYDKQYVRDWLKKNPGSDYLLPDDVIAKTIESYREAYDDPDHRDPVNPRLIIQQIPLIRVDHGSISVTESSLADYNYNSYAHGHAPCSGDDTFR